MYYYTITFFCWLFGGWFGLHHFYLGRDKHGFLWATSCGGFWIGWLREFTRIGRYTDEANKDYPINAARRPSFLTNISRVIGMFIFGVYYRRIFLNAIPDELPSPYYAALVLTIAPLGTTLGVWMVANVGHIECSVKYPIIGAYIGEIMFGYAHIIWEDVNVLLLISCVIFPSIAFWKERRRKIKRRFCHRLLLWVGLGMLFCCMWTSYMYYNVEVYVDELDEDVKLRNILSEFFNSPEWQRLKKEVKNLIHTLWESGGDYEKTWFLFQEGVATSRIRQALETLDFKYHNEFTEEITETVLTKRYRELIRQWHPDKHPPEEKERAQGRFIEIQKAYETLKTVIKRKTKRKTEL